MEKDLISRKALLEIYKNWLSQLTKPEDAGDRNGVETCIAVLEDAPGVDVEPVRRGSWGECRITGYDGLHAVYTRPCSECGHEARFSTNYCPICGVKMDVEV